MRGQGFLPISKYTITVSLKVFSHFFLTILTGSEEFERETQIQTNSSRHTQLKILTFLHCKSDGLWGISEFHCSDPDTRIRLLSEPCLTQSRDLGTSWHQQTVTLITPNEWILLSSGLTCPLIPLAGKVSLLCLCHRRSEMVFERWCRCLLRSLGMANGMEVVSAAESHPGV